MKVKDIAKSVVLSSDGSVLLLRRSKTDTRRPGEWDFPGGGFDEGEGAVQAAARELEEEAGISVDPSEVKIVYVGTELHDDASVNRYLGFITVGDSQSIAIKLSFEHDEYKWVSLDQALIDFPHPFYGTGLAYALEHGLISRS